MGRYTGPVCRLCRRASDKLFLKGDKCYTHCTLERKRTPPGSPLPRRRRVSERGLQLREKQKARWIYFIQERQFRNYFDKAARRLGMTGENLMVALETRLDNTVYRLGFAGSRRQARQLVLHSHFSVNGEKVNIPSYRVKPGDTIAWKEGGTKLEYYKAMARDIQGKAIPPWLSLDLQTLTGRVLRLPQRSEVETKIDDRAIVEYYSR